MSKTKFIVGAVQLNSGNDLVANLRHGAELVKQAAGKGAEFVALPENAFFMRGENDEFPAPEKIIPHMQKLAGDSKIWLQFCIILSDSQAKFRNRSILLNPQGEIAAHYDKIHLFDVDVPNGESHRESDTIIAGDEAVIAELPWGKLGMTICYDLRFPGLFRTLAQNGAKFITVPSAFTYKTGEAHWHTLLKARAIENSCYVIAPAQVGNHPRNRRTYGHSLIIDPWGEILAESLQDKQEVITAEINVERVDEIRKHLPGWKFD